MIVLVSVVFFLLPQVSDDSNIMGVVQTETIQVVAEAYDVILDMSFPKGADGGLDFDIVRVGAEEKNICMLKNKGRYDIEYRSAKITSIIQLKSQFC